MYFGILGPTQLRLVDGRDVVVRGPRLRTLLVLLLLDAGRVVSPQRLIDGLYGTDPPAGAANALQSQVSRLRQAFSRAGGRDGVVEFHPAGYRLAVDRDDVDAHRFARLAAEGRAALTAGEHARAVAVLREALDLWRGAPLADALDAQLVRAEAARLEELRVSAVEDHVEARLALGVPEPLVAELRALVAAYPLRERLRGLLMRALHSTGRRAEALAAFVDARRVLADELGADPSAELTAVHVAVLRGEPPSAFTRPGGPALPAAEQPDQVRPAPAPPGRTGLPGHFSSFVGREDELRRVGKLLAQARLVTLNGPGGAGKTRLAIEAAGQATGEVCFVELTAVIDGADLPHAVLHALGLRDPGLRAPADPRRNATERLAAALAERPLLLVLDNCEHLVADAARFTAALLSACPMLRILATSREPLGLTGETLCPLSGLALPPEGTPATAAREFAAVRLFADRAADVAPDFAVTPANVGAIRQICRTLDGLPLAIELAAARLRALPLAEVAARLDDRFRLLSRGSRAAEPRHQTLRAVVEWSWDLLDDAERVLARRLSVFAGGATLEAAERVCGLPAHEVVDVLTGLVDKSLVEVAGGRYRMLETVRAFAAERLAEAGEAEQLRRSHASYFLELAQTADPHLRRAEQLEWLRRLDTERDNLHAALRGGLVHADAETALRLIAALSFYWWVRGLRGEAATLAGELLTRIGAGPPPGLEEEYALCVLTAALGESASVPPDGTVGSAEVILQALGRPPRQPFLLYLSAMAAGPPPEIPDSLAAFLEGSRPLVGLDPWSRALVAIGHGLIRMFDGQVEHARRDVAVALGGFRTLGDRWGTIMALAAMAELDGHSASVALIDEALRLADELDSTIDMADLLRVRGDGYARAGDVDRADADYVRAEELARRAGAPESVAAIRAGRAEVARLRGDLDAARRLAESALAGCPTGWFGANVMRFEILVALGRIAAEAGDADAARGWYQRAVVDPVGGRNLPALAQAVAGIVGGELARGDGQRAALLLGAATVLLPDAAAGAADLARLAAAAKKLVGDAAYEAAFGRGAAMTREQAREVLGG